MASHWRTASRKVIDKVITDNPDLKGTPELWKLVSKAYPFGQRSLTPYKMWLKEVREAKHQLAVKGSPYDYTAVCLVAHDLVELGREAEAIALLDEQAPNRLNRGCPACGSWTGKPCRDPDPLWNRRFHDRIVPHEARVKTRSGPLFGDFEDDEGTDERRRDEE